MVGCTAMINQRTIQVADKVLTTCSSQGCKYISKKWFLILNYYLFQISKSQIIFDKRNYPFISHFQQLLLGSDWMNLETLKVGTKTLSEPKNSSNAFFPEPEAKRKEDISYSHRRMLQSEEVRIFQNLKCLTLKVFN